MNPLMAIIVLLAPMTEVSEHNFHLFIPHDTQVTVEIPPQKESRKLERHLVKALPDAIHQLQLVELKIDIICRTKGHCQEIKPRKSIDHYYLKITFDKILQIIEPSNDITVNLGLDFLDDKELSQWKVRRSDAFFLHNDRVVELSGTFYLRKHLEGGESFIRYTNRCVELAEFHTRNRVYRIYPTNMSLTSRGACRTMSYVIEVEQHPTKTSKIRSSR